MRKSICYMSILVAAQLGVATVIAQTAKAPATGSVAPLLTKALSDVPNKEAMVLTVSYPPGGTSPAHRHNADVFVYVLEGSVVMQVAGGQEVTLQAGQTFYESPTDIHSVSRNASATMPAKILVVAIKAQGAPLTLPVH